MATAFLRIAASIGTLVGASWLAVDWLDERLTARIIASTEEAMKNPVVLQEVDALLSRVAHRLMFEPETESKIASFITSMASEPALHEGTLRIFTESLLSEQFKTVGVKLMKDLSILVLSDSVMRDKLEHLSHNLILGVGEVVSIEKQWLKVGVKLPTAPVAEEYKGCEADFSRAIAELQDRMRKEHIKHLLMKMSLSVSLPVFQPLPVFELPNYEFTF